MAAVAHVAAEPTGVGFLPQPEQQLFYDEAAACIHLVEGRMITAVALPPPMYTYQHSYKQGWGSASGSRPASVTGGDGSAAASASQALGGLLGSAAPSAVGLAAGADPAGYESDSSIASATTRAFLVSEGPPVRHIRSSLDGAFTALHRSARLVEVHCHATGNMFVETAGVDKQGRKGGDPQLLGFFWTAAHFVMVTAGGLEIHSVHPSRQALRLDSTVPLAGVQWYTYSPETHMVVLGFGSSGAKLQAIQFSKAGTLKLPLLDLTPPWGSPIRPVMAANISTALDGFSAAREQPARLVGPDTCWVVVLYGRVYCCHHDRGAGVLRMYRMFRDATSLAHQYEVYARQLELSVVDNVLLVHHIDTAVVMLLDTMAAGPAPISSPLPLAVPLVEDPELLPGGSVDPSQEASAAAVGPGGAGEAAGMRQEAGHAQQAGAAVAAAGATALQLHYPAWLVDCVGGLVFRLQLDLRAIADSQSDYPRLLAFLQRRQPSAAPRRDAAGITLAVLRSLVRDEAPLSLLRVAFDIVNGVYASSTSGTSSSQGPGPGSGQAAGSSSGGSGQQAASQQQQQQGAPETGGAAGPLRGSTASLAGALQQRPVVTPQDLYTSAFSLLRVQHAARPCYLQAALAQYLASCHAHGLPIPPSLPALCVDLLLDQGLPHLVPPLLLSQPQLDSVLLAEHLEDAEASGKLPQGSQLADQLLLRLAAHEARCRLLLRHGRVREALVLARQRRLVGQLAPAALLEAAAGTGDAMLFAAAHRMCALQAQASHGAAAAHALGSLVQAAQAHRHFFRQLAVLQA